MTNAERIAELENANRTLETRIAELEKALEAARSFSTGSGAARNLESRGTTSSDKEAQE